MGALRILVVDDASAVRRLLADVLSSDPGLEVVGMAANGREGLAKIESLKPDAVILDVEMPELDGLSTLRELRPVHPRLPVVMFSSQTEEGAKVTLDALALGASDFCPKPAGLESRSVATAYLRAELIPRLKQFIPGAAPRGQAAPHKLPPGSQVEGQTSRVDAVAISASTGGPAALQALLSGLPRDLPVPVLVVQHMPALFTRMFAERMNGLCALSVREATSGDAVQPGVALIAPGDWHMTVVQAKDGVKIETNQEPPQNSVRPAADVLFRSVARVYGPRALAVVLTGMGRDGLVGCDLIKQAGGQVITQDKSTSIVWAMAQCVVEAGLADAVAPLAELPRMIVGRVAQGRI